MQKMRERVWPRVYLTAAAAMSTALAVYALAAPFEEGH